MPRNADRDARRARITDALIRLAARDGLHRASLRAIAAEAGISLRLVQYYFGDRAALLHAALEELERRSHARWKARLARLPQPPPPRALLDAFVAEALPTDAASRDFHRVFSAYALLAQTEPDLAMQPFIDGPRRLERQLARTLRRAQAQGDLDRRRDPVAEAATLNALVHGMGTSVLIGQRSARSATRLLRAHLDRLLTAPD